MSWLIALLGWLYDFITNPAVSLFLGAFLGGLCGYGANWWHDRQETRARRGALFRVLSDQLHSVPSDELKSDYLTLGPIHVSAADALLRGDVLDARKDAMLIKWLIVWQGIEASFNEAAQMANRLTISVGGEPTYRRQMGKIANGLLEELRTHRSRILEVLPAEYRLPSWPQDEGGPPDEGIMIAPAQGG